MSRPLSHNDGGTSVVVDFGSHTVRAGYSGEELPKHVPYNFVGEVEVDSKSTRYCGDSAQYVRDPNITISRPMENGLVKDWDLFDCMLNYTLNLFWAHADAAELPFLFTEAAWAPAEDRKKLAELIFEKYQIPATYFAKSQVCSAFANGKSTALVVDSGATHTSVVPVIDGLVLKKSIKQNDMGAQYVQKCVECFAEKKGIDLAVRQEIESKEKVHPGEKPKFVKQADRSYSKSWLSEQKEQLLEDCVKHFVTIPVSQADVVENNQENKVVKEYEFPTGYTHIFGTDRLAIAESLFVPQDDRPCVTSLVKASVNSCDPDLRPTLMSGCILAGGNTLIEGYGERLIYEMQKKNAPTLKFRVINSGKSSHNEWERQFSSWTGASILSSLATVNDLWICRKQYEEEGMRILDRKCH